MICFIRRIRKYFSNGVDEDFSLCAPLFLFFTFHLSFSRLFHSAAADAEFTDLNPFARICSLTGRKEEEDVRDGSGRDDDDGPKWGNEGKKKGEKKKMVSREQKYSSSNSAAFPDGRRRMEKDMRRMLAFAVLCKCERGMMEQKRKGTKKGRKT